MPIFVNDLLRSSFRCIGQLRPGFGHSPSELVDGLFILNAMLDSWATDDLNAFCELIQTFTLVPGTGTYTIGATGTWVGERPVKIDQATLVNLSNPVHPMRQYLPVGDQNDYQLVVLQDTESTLPQRAFYNPTHPLGTIHFHPVPSFAHQVEIVSGQWLAGGFTVGNTAFTAPPGYLDAVRYHLAVRLAFEWDKPLKPGVEKLASEALAKVQRANAPSPQFQCNPAVPGLGGGGDFDITAGD